MLEPDNTFTSTQLEHFHSLRARYAEDQDQFTDRELAHLCFLRWLVKTGSLTPARDLAGRFPETPSATPGDSLVM